MRLLHWLVGLFLPACAGIGAQGLPVPPPLDIMHIERPASPNTALAAPADFSPKPDLVTPVYDVPAPRLYAAIRAVALAEPRTYAQIAYDDRLQAHFVARTKWMNFPDLITVQVLPRGADKAALVLWSRSVYGYSDLGVNRGRLEAWLAALDTYLRSHQG